MVNTIMQSLIKLASENKDVLALWLYGSHSNNSYHNASDYDLAVLFDSRLKDPLEKRLRPELLALDWTQFLELPELAVSVVDIQVSPTPLAMNAISGQLLYCQDHSARLFSEGRIMSKAELDYAYHFKNLLSYVLKISVR